MHMDYIQKGAQLPAWMFISVFSAAFLLGHGPHQCCSHPTTTAQMVCFPQESQRPPWPALWTEGLETGGHLQIFEIQPECPVNNLWSLPEGLCCSHKTMAILRRFYQGQTWEASFMELNWIEYTWFCFLDNSTGHRHICLIESLSTESLNFPYSHLLKSAVTPGFNKTSRNLRFKINIIQICIYDIQVFWMNKAEHKQQLTARWWVPWLCLKLRARDRASLAFWARKDHLDARHSSDFHKNGLDRKRMGNFNKHVYEMNLFLYIKRSFQPSWHESSNLNRNIELKMAENSLKNRKVRNPPVTDRVKHQVGKTQNDPWTDETQEREHSDAITLQR